MTTLRIGASIAAIAIISFGCNGAKPPTAPAVTVNAVRVNPAGSGSATLMTGETRQLSATATQSNGGSLDVTNSATWQSSATSVATVSPSGLVTAVAEGTAEISATYNGVRGALRTDIQPTCTVTVSPPTASFNAFGGSGSVNVSVNSTSCRWSARSQAPWFPFVYEPAQPGSGSFSYTVPANSTTSARAAAIVVETSTAQTATFSITEDRPAGCSYVTQPEEIAFTASGGTGQFNVIATPSDCQWNLINGMASLGVSVISGFSGRGNSVVRYAVQAHTRSVDADGYLEIAGLSGLNPNGRHHIIVAKR